MTAIRRYLRDELGIAPGGSGDDRLLATTVVNGRS